MKKGSYLYFAIILVVFCISNVSAEVCNLDASLISQDPYPAVPGEYVKLVFQLDGVDNQECGIVSFQLIEEYPFTLDASQSSMVQINSGFYASGYENFLTIPYKVRVDGSAFEGENELKVFYTGSGGASPVSKKFNIEIDDFRTDFEISIKDYDYVKSTITFEILNIGENDVESLAVEIPKQENIIVKGSNRNIVGGLDSNEDTTFTFEAVPKDGNIDLKIAYNDEINVRKELTKIAVFDSSYFKDRKRDEKSTPFYLYLLVVAVIVVAIWYVSKKVKAKKKKNAK